MDLKNHRTNPDLEKGGVLVSFDAETSFRIGSLSGQPYKDAFARKITEARKKHRELTGSETEAIIMECYAEAIVRGWHNLKDGGKEIPYSKEAAFEMLKTCPAIKEFIYAQAQSHDNFRAERVEVAKEQAGKP